MTTTQPQRDFDPDMQIRQDNARRLEQIGEAYIHGREISFSGAQKHMRFAWEKASVPLEDLVESLYGFFGRATAVEIAAGGPHPFNKDFVQLSVALEPVAYVTLREGNGNGFALLGSYLADPRFQALCRQHDVHEVYTPANDLEVRAQRVRHHNEPRPL